MDRTKITFNGKPLPELSNAELQDALVAALKSRNSYRQKLERVTETMRRASELSASVERIWKKSRQT